MDGSAAMSASRQAVLYLAVPNSHARPRITFHTAMRRDPDPRAYPACTRDQRAMAVGLLARRRTA
jgi:hypothetical protein